VTQERSVVDVARLLVRQADGASEGDGDETQAE
jgi:hypothetical protein